ncbi:MAG: tRNA lysidine(34) synthetase TilS [Pseudomonadales bacterium]|nr:tRNA lysidine(34) synthetase TilS [Pseudomonadales bacterium]
MLNPEWLATQLAGYSGNLFVGYSGGVDSHVLLHLIAHSRLQARVVAVHVNHGISESANQWEAHCAAEAAKLHIRYISHRLRLTRQGNLEDEARRGRYGFFASLLAPGDLLLLAHHEDDQIETALFHLLRGSGGGFLKGMPARRALAEGEVCRPLLDSSRSDIEAYARSHKLSWIDDESNADTGYTRNYLRHEVIPVLLQKWPGAKSHLADAIRDANDVRTTLQMQVQQRLQANSGPNGELPLAALTEPDVASLAVFLGGWFERLNLPYPGRSLLQEMAARIDQVRRLGAGAPLFSWQGCELRVHRHALWLLKTLPPADLVAMPVVEGQHQVNGGVLTVSRGAGGLQAEDVAEMHICRRQGGEKIRLHLTRTIKQLYQERQLPGWYRERLPLVKLKGESPVTVCVPAIPALGSDQINAGAYSGGETGWHFTFDLPASLNSAVISSSGV